MSDVRSTTSVPTAANFASSSGTPLVVNRTTGIAYVLDSTESVVEVGFRSTISAVYANTASLTFGAVASNGVAEQTITVTGAAAGDAVAVGAPAALETGLTFSAYVSAANTVTVRLHNNTAGPVTPAVATWRAVVLSFA